MTTDPVGKFFQDLDDPSKFVVLDNVPAMKPYHFAGSGDAVREVAADQLGDWCRQTNALEESGVVTVVTLGHRDQSKSELEQPPIVGYARDFRVGQLVGKPAIVCRVYVMAEHAATAREFPFRSIEFYPNEKKIRGIALLKRDPRLDLGMIAFARGETAMTDMSDDAAKPDETPPVDPNALSDDERATAEKFWRHYEASHPMLAYARTCYEASTPMQAPVKPTDTPPPAAPADDDQQRMQRDQQMVRFAQLEQRLTTLEASNQALQTANAGLQRQVLEAKAEKLVIQLEAEGFSLDRAHTVQTLVNLGPDQWEAQAQYIRKHHVRNGVPVGGGFIPVDTATPVPGGGKKVVTRDIQDKAVKLATAKGISYDAALAEVNV